MESVLDLVSKNENLKSFKDFMECEETRLRIEIGQNLEYMFTRTMEKTNWPLLSNYWKLIGKHSYYSR